MFSGKRIFVQEIHEDDQIDQCYVLSYRTHPRFGVDLHSDILKYLKFYHNF